MAMHDDTTQAIRMKIVIPGKTSSPRMRRTLTLEIITEWIRMQELDEYTTNALIEAASKFPTSALPHFQHNFNLMIARVRRKRRLEQQQGKNENSDSIGTGETS